MVTFCFYIIYTYIFAITHTVSLKQYLSSWIKCISYIPGLTWCSWLTNKKLHFFVGLGICFSCGKDGHWARKTVPYHNCWQHAVQTVDKQDTGRLAALLFLNKGDSPPENSCFTEKSVRYSGPVDEDGCSKDTDRPWVTVRAASRLWHFYSLKATCSVPPVYSGDIHPCQVSDRVED